MFVGDALEEARLLTVCRKLAPVGGWALPGGFVDEGETAEQAIQREVLEECGIRTDISLWVPIQTEITPRNQLLVFMEYLAPLDENVLSNFNENDEVSALGTFNGSTTLCFPLHDKVARAAVNSFQTA